MTLDLEKFLTYTTVYINIKFLYIWCNPYRYYCTECNRYSSTPILFFSINYVTFLFILLVQLYLDSSPKTSKEPIGKLILKLLLLEERCLNFIFMKLKRLGQGYFP